MPQKKIFYALRPAAALRWLRHHPDEAVAPMHFPTLINGCAAPSQVIEIVTELMARKALTRELGSEPLSASILAFIDAEFADAHEFFAATARPVPQERRDQAQAFFMRTVRRLSA